MSKLPKDWAFADLPKILAPLDDEKVLHQGWSPRCEKEPAESENDWAALKTTAIQNGWFDPSFNKRLPDTLNPKPNLEVKSGDILITCAGPRMRCGISCLVGYTRPRLMLSGKMYRMRANEEIILPEYLLAYLRSPDAQRTIDGLKTGGNDSGLNFTQERFLSLQIPVAPKTQQQRIVAKLNRLFARSHRARKELERIPKLIDRYKQAVLEAACSGYLTADWRKERGSEAAWQSTLLGELIIGKPKNGYSAKPVNCETPFRVLTLTATTSGKFNSEHFKYFDEIVGKESQFWLQPNDILVQRGNTIEYVGVSAIYDGAPNQFVFPDLMMRLRAKSEVETHFLHMVLSCEKSRNYLRSKATGTAGNMPKINQPTLVSLPINLPQLEEQKEIVNRVETLFKAIDLMAQEYQKASKLCDRLEQATLAKAFRGELVPQDPNDETAAALLERLRAEKPAQTKGKGVESKQRSGGRS